MIRALVVMSLLSGGPVTPDGAQGVCVPPTLKITSVSGRVIRTYSKGDEPLDGATVTVRKGGSRGSVVAEATTDADGRFSFPGIRPGKYVVVLEKPLYITFVFPIKVNKSRTTPTQPDEIVASLGADYNDSCGGSYAGLRKRQP